MKVTLVDNFWECCEADIQGCLVWKRARNKEGYGEVQFRGKLWRASRVAWVLTQGEIPEGKLVLHKCDNPPCVNPDHLYLGTLKDNSRDAIERGLRPKKYRKRRSRVEIDAERSERLMQKMLRRLKPKKIARGILKGEDKPRAKLTTDQVIQMRQKYGGPERSVTYLKIAAEYRISFSVAHRILTGQSWKHVGV